MSQVIIIRYSEIALKGSNRNLFESKLASNIEGFLEMHSIPYSSIKRPRGRIICHLANNIEPEQIQFLENVPGIASFNLAESCNADVEKIKSRCLSQFPKQTKSFRVSVSRVDKSFHLKSMELERVIGDIIIEKYNTPVSLKNFDTEIIVEILGGQAYISVGTRHKGQGGLPVGITGVVIVAYTSSKSDEAARLVMKRGCKVMPVMVGKNITPEIDKYDCSADKPEKVNSISELNGLAEEKGIRAVVFDVRYPEIPRFRQLIKKDILVLFPLAI